MAATHETILVTGGLGYIGSHICEKLIRENNTVIIVDNLSNSSEDRLPSGCKFYQADIRYDIEYIFKENTINRVIHLAALKSVPDSEIMKDEYYDVNVRGTKNVLSCMNGYCNRIEFASSASVYGNTDTPAKESDQLNPQSYYAKTKVLGENLIRESGYDYAVFRYFNPIGFLPHLPDTGRNILPLLLNFSRIGKEFTICGDEFDTKDGTCARDYIDIQDLISVHEMNLSGTYNVGSGRPVTVKQLVNTFNKYSPNKILFKFGSARIGDPGILVADCSKIVSTGFEAKLDIETSLKNIFIGK